MCLECEPKFALLEQRLAAIEMHHPIMDFKTEQAQATAEAALEQAEEAQEEAEAASEMAEEAAEVAVTAMITQVVEQEETSPVEEPIIQEEEESGLDTGTASESRRETTGETSETEIGSPAEPVVIAIEPERKREPATAKSEPHDSARLRFRRGR